MDRTTKIICGLLQNPNHMRRCAAAITLAELAPKDATVVRALGEALQDANPMMIPYVLEALEAIGSPVAVPYVLPLLDSGEIEIKLRAAAIVSRAGSAVVPQILERIAQAAPAQRPCARRSAATSRMWRPRTVPCCTKKCSGSWPPRAWRPRNESSPPACCCWAPLPGPRPARRC